MLPLTHWREINAEYHLVLCERAMGCVDGGLKHDDRATSGHSEANDASDRRPDCRHWAGFRHDQGGGDTPSVSIRQPGTVKEAVDTHAS